MYKITCKYIIGERNLLEGRYPNLMESRWFSSWKSSGISLNICRLLLGSTSLSNTFPAASSFFSPGIICVCMRIRGSDSSGDLELDGVEIDVFETDWDTGLFEDIDLIVMKINNQL